ncbi:MAG: PQQ-dependent sugar dehydrogenase [Gammaproteobacteria bacterium]|nr:PQQ-dependent sugar dehydrogenase [Gammaproteobacteria bacterium]
MKKIISTSIFSVLFLCLNACSQSPADIQLPQGFKLNIYADNVPGARQMAQGDRGTIFVGSKKSGRVYALVDSNNDGKADQRIIIKNKLSLPTGIAFFQGDLFVSGPDKILRYSEIENELADISTPTVVIDKLPLETHHGMRTLEFGPDNMLYTAIGMPCNICSLQNPIMGSLLRINPVSGDYSIYASGIRNSAGLAWQKETGRLWFTDNGRDWLGDDLPPDEINSTSTAGQHFGFPYVYGNNSPEADYFSKRPEQLTFTPPSVLLQAHTAPLGLAFYFGSQFPVEYKGSLFVAQHGSWNRSAKVGYRVINIRLKNNKPVSQIVFAEGWLKSPFAGGRPVDILTLKDGTILISDDKAGKVYRISYQPKNNN